MPDVETKVSTVRVHLSVGSSRTSGRIAPKREQVLKMNVFQLLPDGNKTEIKNKKTVKEGLKLFCDHLRSFEVIRGH